MTTAVEIELNGATREVEGGASLADLVLLLELPAKGVAVAVNREVVPKRQWATRRLQRHDRVEVVRAIGGG